MSRSSQDYHEFTLKNFQNSKIQIPLAKLLWPLMVMVTKVGHLSNVFTKSKMFIVSVIWRGNEDEYFQTRIEDIKLILNCIKRNNPGLISQINEDVSKL